jgi:hypothetical protein
MSTLSIQLPRSVRECVENLAREEGMSVDAYIASVITRLAAVAEADSYIRRRAARGSPEQLAALLAKAPDAPPLPGDELK